MASLPNLDSNGVARQVLRQEEGLELASAAPKNDLGIHLIDPVDQIYSYTSPLGRLVGWILYQCGYTIRCFNQDTQVNNYYSLSSTMQCLCNTPNKNVNIDELASSKRLRTLTQNLFSTLKNPTTENFDEFVRNFRKPDFLSILQLANDPARAEQLLEVRLSAFITEASSVQ